MQQQRNGRPLGFEHPPAADVASALMAAQQRALEQRLAAEALLAEARSLEDRLATEILTARAVAERDLAQEHAARAIAAAQLEREAIVGVEASEAHLVELTRQRDALESAVREAHTACDIATASVADCEQRLLEARATLERAVQARSDVDARWSDSSAAQTAAEAQARDAAQRLAEHRAVRQDAENASREAEERARALGLHDGAEPSPSLAPLEELQLLETRIALRTEASKRAAERRASDAARHNAAH